MEQTSNKPVRPAQWAAIVLLSALAGGLLVQLGVSASASAQPVSAGSGQGPVFAVAGQISGQTYGLYLVDYEKQTISVYQYEPKTRKLEWRAARTYRFDVQMDAYNTAAPEPSEVQRLVDQARRLGSE